MAGLLDGVLAINRAERGKAEFDPVTLDLAALCQNIIGEARTTAPTTLSFELVCTGSCTEVKADPKLLQLIISNLISNAVKYSRPGGKVTIGLACHAHQSILSVQDEGMGIPKEAQPHVFEPFYRADNVGDLAGTGLGLAIVRQCVEQHGGTVSFTSEAERGTTFVVTLPNIAFMERQYGENFDH
jgi:signal transduction histidine kinase